MVEFAPFIGMLVFFAYLFVLDIDFSRARARGGACILRLRGLAGHARRHRPSEMDVPEVGDATDPVVQFEVLIARSRRQRACGRAIGDTTMEKPSQ
ncbi:hypothetical protein [Tropicimonas aquimaris]|uniref:Secreted protein n=1 Tax=Tropicimonas aquimaris TaxID=914152 RepID=A0ABW3IRZ8_9RHOB